VLCRSICWTTLGWAPDSASLLASGRRGNTLGELSAALAPTVRQSNQKASDGRLAPHGNRHLRHVMVESSWRACGQAPAYEMIFQRVTARRGMTGSVSGPMDP